MIQGGAEGVSWGYCDYLCGAGVGDALGAAVVHATVVTLRSEDASSSALAIQVRAHTILLLYANLSHAWFPNRR